MIWEFGSSPFTFQVAEENAIQALGGAVQFSEGAALQGLGVALQNAKRGARQVAGVAVQFSEEKVQTLAGIGLYQRAGNKERTFGIRKPLYADEKEEIQKQE